MVWLDNVMIRKSAGWAAAGVLAGAATGLLLGVDPLVVALSFGATAAIARPSFVPRDVCPPRDPSAKPSEATIEQIGAVVRDIDLEPDHAVSDRFRVLVSAPLKPGRSRSH